MALPDVLKGVSHWRYVSRIAHPSNGTSSIEYDSANGDTLVVNYNTNNEPTAWQATVNGVVYLTVPAFGEVELTPEQWEAFLLFANDPALLDALQTYQSIYNAIRGIIPPG